MSNLPLLLLLCLATSLTEGRWPRAARPVARPQERRAPGHPLPRLLVPRRPSPSRAARVTEWRNPKVPRIKNWGGHNYIFQDNRWSPLYGKQTHKQGRHVGLPGKRINGLKSWPKVQPWQDPRAAAVPPRVAPVTTPRPQVPITFPTFLANPNSIRRIDTVVVKDAQLAEPLNPDIEIDGLKIYKFRGEDSMAGYIAPISAPILWSQARVTTPSPPSTPRPRPPPTWRPEQPPPFPTRHTTPHPHNNPVIIIGQSSVHMN